jgi:hypothetical protein
MSRLKSFGLVVCAALLGFSSVVAAADTFQGTFWSLSTDGIDLDVSSSTKTYAITLAVDTSGYTGTGSFLDQVAIKVSSSLIGASLVSAPGGIGNWNLAPGGINASGCSGSGGGFECADSVTLNGSNAVPGGLYTWVFDLVMANGALLTGPLQDSVKGRFVDVSGNKVGALVSENITMAVPEPEIYAMMGLGLGLLGWVGRRRKPQAV